VTAGGRVKTHPWTAHLLDWLDAFTWLASAYSVNPNFWVSFWVLLYVYAMLCHDAWDRGVNVMGNDGQGSISYGVSLMVKED